MTDHIGPPIHTNAVSSITPIVTMDGSEFHSLTLTLKKGKWVLMNVQISPDNWSQLKDTVDKLIWEAL